MYFINIKDNLALCEVMEKTFKDYIEPFYGNQRPALEKILAGIDRSCEIFCIKGKPIGLIVYKTSLQNEFDLKDAFELKTTFIHKPYRNQGMGKHLFQHAYTLAQDSQAKYIYGTVSKDLPHVISYLKNQNWVEHTTTTSSDNDIDVTAVYKELPDGK